MEARRKAAKTYKENPTNKNLATWRRMQARCRRAALQSKKESFGAFCQSLNRDTDISTIWHKINSLSKGICHRPFRNSPTNEEVFREVLDHLTPPDVPQNLPEIRINLNKQVIPISPLEFSTALKQKKDSSPGEDIITYSIIKNLPVLGKNYLLTHFNKILLGEKIPNSWRDYIIIPILKQNKDENSPKSYRPIAMSSTLAKLMETIIKIRLEWELEHRQILSETQFGFRKGRSVTDAISLLINDLMIAKYSQIRKKNHTSRFFGFKICI